MALKFSANLGFLWTELSLLDAIRAAKKAGFHSVECHWPYDTDAHEVAGVLRDEGLEMLGLNTVRGGVGENGLLALVGRDGEARASIDQAIEYARITGTKNIHAMAGFAHGNAAKTCFISNLEYACARAEEFAITILIEPLNSYDAPNYFLQTTSQAEEIIAEVQAPNLKLMFDCYHVQIMEGDISRRLERLLSIIGHIQFASVPDRAEPDTGEVNYPHVFRVIEELGVTQPVGAEYKPASTTDAGLGWLTQL